MANDHKRNTGEGGAGHVQVTPLDVGHIPEAGDALAEVRVIGHDRLAIGALGRPDHPVIRGLRHLCQPAERTGECLEAGGERGDVRLP